MCWIVQCDGRGLQDRKLNRSGVETKDRNKKRKHLIRDEDEAAEEHQRSPHRGACCWPFARRKEKRLGFFELEEEEGKGSSGRWRNYSADGVIYSPRWGR